jgi:hypothetical protein
MGSEDKCEENEDSAFRKWSKSEKEEKRNEKDM